MHPRDSSPSFTVLDWAATIAASGAALGLVAFPLVSRTYAAMFKDFGGPLPVLTRAVLLPWFPLALGAVVIALLVASRAAIASRRMLIAFAFVFGCACLGLCVFAMYLPIFSIAASIKPE